MIYCIHYQYLLIHSRNCTSFMGGILLRIKIDFVFARSLNLRSEINLKLNKGLNKFRKGSNWYCYGYFECEGIHCKDGTSFWKDYYS